MFKASKSNIAQLQKEGSLAAAGLQSLEAQCSEDNGSTSTHPQTIREAMQVVESFCERYLWVDALCVQDSEEEKCEELSKMSAIYTGRTSQSYQRPETTPILVYWVLNTTRCETDLAILIRKGPMMFVPQFVITRRGLRALCGVRGDGHFKSNYFPGGFSLFRQCRHLECHCAVFHEAMGYKIGRSLRFQDCDERFQKHANGFHYTSWPDLAEYARLVFDYNQRKLTYSNDIFDAFDGVFSTLSRTFQGGFHCGLPAVFPDVCLLRQPMASMIRRDSGKTGMLLPC